MPIIFRIYPLLFLITLTVFGFIAIKGLRQWLYNNRQPVLYDHAVIVDKRFHVWGSRSNTSYYITFEFEEGNRQEFMVPSRIYGQLAPGDCGTLTWQGTRFLSFERVATGNGDGV